MSSRGIGPSFTNKIGENMPNNDQNHLPGHRPHYSIQVADAQLNFRNIDLHDGIVTGRQLLEAYGARPAEEHQVIALLPDGSTETMRLDEDFDLRGRGVERFVVFKSDRSFRFFVDRREKEWGEAKISGSIIKFLAGVDAALFDLYQEVRGGEDPIIGNEDCVDLGANGSEQFFTVKSQTTEGASLPMADSGHLTARGISFAVESEAGQASVIFKDYPLPAGRYDRDRTDVLVLLPSAYPDAVVDMFYCDPWIKVASTGLWPSRADVSHSHGGRNWQRWSRHSNEWRAGIDGMHTVLSRIDRALKDAA